MKTFFARLLFYYGVLVAVYLIFAHPVGVVTMHHNHPLGTGVSQR